MKTSELTGTPLDWVVAKCMGVAVEYVNDGITRCLLRKPSGRYAPSTDWAQGGPIIEREEIAICPGYSWEASMEIEVRGESDAVVTHGPTLLVAAMRCFAVSHLGDEVDVPKGLYDQ